MTKIIILATFILLFAKCSQLCWVQSFVVLWKIEGLIQILDSSKLKEFTDDNFKLEGNGGDFSKQVENTVEKGEIAHYKQFLLFPHCYKKSVLQTCKKQGLFEKRLKKNHSQQIQLKLWGFVMEIVENMEGKRKNSCCSLPHIVFIGFFILRAVKLQTRNILDRANGKYLPTNKREWVWSINILVTCILDQSHVSIYSLQCDTKRSTNKKSKWTNHKYMFIHNSVIHVIPRRMPMED